ncbi:hypothetical protein [uncultured Roseobacter sp.]|uniref:hypothetical protein n=1 Tax=uncultured Roseobacter sp. TaxID=114847 RepID=UPI0026040D31|nr:hypothetical protein [uncultured Roseobacter sp.]
MTDHSETIGECHEQIDRLFLSLAKCVSNCRSHNPLAVTIAAKEIRGLLSQLSKKLPYLDEVSVRAKLDVLKRLEAFDAQIKTVNMDAFPAHNSPIRATNECASKSDNILYLKPRNKKG